MAKRLRLTGNYRDGRLVSVTFSKGAGSFSVPVRSDEHASTDERTPDQQATHRLTFREWAERTERLTSENDD
jgi:hypothetical protein